MTKNTSWELKNWFLSGILLFIITSPLIILKVFELPDSLTLPLVMVGIVSLVFAWYFFGWLVATPFILIYQIYLKIKNWKEVN